MMYVLDTNHSSVLLDRRSQLRRRTELAQRSDQFYLCRPSVAELWYMVLNSGRPRENQENLEQLLRWMPTVEFGELSAIEYGRIRTELRRVGRPIPSVDVMIAAIARTERLDPLTADSHFNHVQGIRLENSLTP